VEAPNTAIFEGGANNMPNELKFSPLVCGPNTWRLNATGEGVGINAGAAIAMAVPLFQTDIDRVEAKLLKAALDVNCPQQDPMFPDRIPCWQKAVGDIVWSNPSFTLSDEKTMLDKLTGNIVCRLGLNASIEITCSK
jgi:hypothetical protein